jgi:hypothetical protein
MSTRGAARRRLALAGLGLGSVLATAVAVDVALRVARGPVRVVEDFYAPDPRCGYRMRPHIVFEFANPYHGYRATVRTNGHGLRGPEFQVRKPPGLFRILLLGDSMTAGLEVGEDATFAAICRRMLASERPVEVINAGVRGWNLDNVRCFLETDGLAWEPDVVVYLFVDNDVTAAAEFAPNRTDTGRRWTPRGLAARLAAHSHVLYRLALLREQRLLRRARDRDAGAGRADAVPGGIVALFSRSADDPAFGPTTARIERLAVLCRERGIRFVLAGVPHRQEIEPEAQRWLQAHVPFQLDADGVRHYLDRVAGTAGATRLDPVPVFRDRLPADRTYWWHRDDHLNERGHRLLGELLGSCIASLPEWRSPGAGGRAPRAGARPRP